VTAETGLHDTLITEISWSVMNDKPEIDITLHVKTIKYDNPKFNFFLPFFNSQILSSRIIDSVAF